MNTQELKKYPSVIERYYDQKYVIGKIIENMLKLVCLLKLVYNRCKW